jgi:hypothetical protein
LKKILVVLGLVVASAAITAPSQAVEQPEVFSTITAPIVAAKTSLSFSKVEVKTSPAITAPVQEVAVVEPEVVSAAPEAVTVVPEVEAQRCEEDMPCWDCKTMGNKICGAETEDVKVAPHPGCTGPEVVEVYEDGSCLTENGFFEPGVEEEVITAPEEPTVFETPVEGERVENNGNPDCQVPNSIQYADGSCTIVSIVGTPTDPGAFPGCDEPNSVLYSDGTCTFPYVPVEE